jgi:hypothetical protein
MALTYAQEQELAELKEKYSHIANNKGLMKICEPIIRNTLDNSPNEIPYDPNWDKPADPEAIETFLSKFN